MKRRKQKKQEQQILVIGMGRFGQNLAKALVAGGVEVMAIDADEAATEAVANEVTHVLIADCTDEKVLREIGPEQFDVVVLAIGSDIQASIMTTLLLKEIGVKRLVGKATSALHGRTLEKLGVDRVVFPERDVAHRVAQDFLAPHMTEILPLTVSQSMFEMAAPKSFHGQNLLNLNLREKYEMNILAIKRDKETIVSPPAGELLHKGDILLVLGNREKAEKALGD